MRDADWRAGRGQVEDVPGGAAVPMSLSQIGRDLGQLRERLMTEAEVRPLRTAALAVAAGYLLGGGLFSKLTARLVGTSLRVGLRVAFIPFVTQGLVAWGGELFEGPQGPRVSSDARRRDRGHRERSDSPKTDGVGPFAAGAGGEASGDELPKENVPRKSVRQTDPKEKNP